MAWQAKTLAASQNDDLSSIPRPCRQRDATPSNSSDLHINSWHMCTHTQSLIITNNKHNTTFSRGFNP